MAITIDELVYTTGLDDQGLVSGERRVRDILHRMSNAAATSFLGLQFPASIADTWEIGLEAIRRGAGALVEFSQRSLALAGVEQSFNALATSASQSGEAILSAMRRAAGGTITDFELMQRANTAFNLGLAVTPKNMADLLTIARSSAQSMGESFDFMVESIVTGLGRQSPLILDNLGIVIDSTKAYETYGAGIGKTAKTLTDAEKKQAFFNAAMEAGMRNVQRAGGVTASATDRFDQMNVAVDRAQLALGRIATPAVIGIFNALAGGVTQVANQLEMLNPLFEGASERAARLREEMTALKSETDAQISTISGLQAEYNRLNQRLSDENITADESRQLHSDLNAIIAKLQAAVPSLAGVFRNYGNDVRRVNNLLNQTIGAQRRLLRVSQRESAQAMLEEFRTLRVASQRMGEAVRDLEDDIVRNSERLENWRKAAERMRRGKLVPGGRDIRFLSERIRESQDELDTLREQFGEVRGNALDAERAMLDFLDVVGLRENLQENEAAIRRMFGVSGEAARQLIADLIELDARQKALAAQPVQPAASASAVGGLSEKDLKALGDKVKAEMKAVELAGRQAAASSGVAFRANLQAQLDAVRRTLAEQGKLTEEQVLADIGKYSELAETIISLNEKIVAERQKTADEALKTELDRIDKELSGRQIGFQTAVDQLEALKGANQANADALKLINDKQEAVKKRIAQQDAARNRAIAENAKQREADEARQLKNREDDLAKEKAIEQRRTQGLREHYRQREADDEAHRLALLRTQAEGDNRFLAVVEKTSERVLKAQAERAEIEAEFADLRVRLSQARTREEVASIRAEINEFAKANASKIEGTERYGVALDGLFRGLTQQADVVAGLEMKYNRLKKTMETPWGVITNLPALRKGLDDAESQFGRFSDEWMNAQAQWHGAFGELFDFVGAGLDALEIDIGEIGQGVFGVLEGLATGNLFGALVSGLGLVKDVIDEFTDDVRQEALDIRFDLGTREMIRQLDNVQEKLKDLRNEREKGFDQERENQIRELIIAEQRLVQAVHVSEAHEAAVKARQEFVQSFASGLGGGIRGAISDAILQSGDVVDDFGARLGDRFNRALLDVIVEGVVTQRRIQPALEIFAEGFRLAIEDGVIDPLEAEGLQVARDAVGRLAENARQDVERIVGDLDLEFQQQERGMVEGFEQDRRRAEAFQTISNITRFQANQIVGELSAQTAALHRIGDINTQMLNFSQVIAENTRLRAVTVGGNGEVDGQVLADQNIREVQGVGIV
jgi:DNA repair exonuclease SbcCD ATPase subunit